MILKVSSGAPKTSPHLKCGTRIRSPRASCSAPRPRRHEPDPPRSFPACQYGKNTFDRLASSPRSTRPWCGTPRPDRPTALPQSTRRRSRAGRLPSGAPAIALVAASGPRAPPATPTRATRRRRVQRAWTRASTAPATATTRVEARHARARGVAAAARAPGQLPPVGCPAAGSRSMTISSPWRACLGSSLSSQGCMPCAET